MQFYKESDAEWHTINHSRSSEFDCLQHNPLIPQVIPALSVFSRLNFPAVNENTSVTEQARLGEFENAVMLRLLELLLRMSSLIWA